MEIGAIPPASFATQQSQSVIRARSEPLPSERPRDPASSPSRETQAPPPPPPREGRNAEGAQQAQRPEPPKPVVNERGQKTGTIIDTTA